MEAKCSVPIIAFFSRCSCSAVLHTPKRISLFSILIFRMNLSFKCYNLLCVPVILGFILAYIVYDIWFNKDPKIQLPLKEQDYVLYVGDSVSFSFGKCDSGSTSIYDWLQNLSQMTIIPITKEGYSLIVYKDIISVYLAQKVLPKMIIIPLNLRSFNQGWSTQPSMKYPLFRIKNKIKYEKYNFNDLASYLKLRFSNVLTEEEELWKKQKIVYNDLNLGMLSKLHKEMKIDKNLDCNPILKEIYAYELGLQFKYHYMYQLNEAHKMLLYLKQTIAEAKSKNIRIVFYISPVNYIDGLKFVGDKFAIRIEQNLNLLKKILDNEKVDYIDLSKALPPEFFIDQNHACGHLRNEGRKFVAEQQRLDDHY